MDGTKPGGVFRGKRCFISGPVTDIKDRNKAAFDVVEDWLRYEEAESVFNPVRAISEDTSWKDAMRTCLWELRKCRYDMVVCLPGSLESAGSNLEREFAEALDIKIMYLDHSVVDKLKVEAGV